MPLRASRARGNPPAKKTAEPISHVKKVESPIEMPKAEEVKEEPFPPMPIPPDPYELFSDHAAKVDANLRTGGRYPYTPNPKLRAAARRPR